MNKVEELEELKNKAESMTKKLGRLANWYIILAVMMFLSFSASVYKTYQAQKSLNRYDEGVKIVTELVDEMKYYNRRLAEQDSLMKIKYKQLDERDD